MKWEIILAGLVVGFLLIEFIKYSARVRERERIIKILESIRVGDNWIGRDYAIELIKGDNK